MPTKGDLSVRVERRRDPVAEEILESYRDDIGPDFEYKGNIYETIVKEADIDHVVAEIDWDTTTPEKIADILLADERVNQFIDEYVEMIHLWHPRLVEDYPDTLAEYTDKDMLEP